MERAPLKIKLASFPAPRETPKHLQHIVSPTKKKKKNEFVPCQQFCSTAHRALGNWGFRSKIGEAAIRLCQKMQETQNIFFGDGGLGAFISHRPAFAMQHFGALPLKPISRALQQALRKQEEVSLSAMNGGHHPFSPTPNLQQESILFPLPGRAWLGCS